MCGRYVATTPTSVLADVFAAENLTEAEDEESPPPSYNVAPTDPVPVVVERRDGRRAVRGMRWGLVPSWSKDASGAARRINARSETLFSNASFRTAASRRRCIVPANGFYEWQRVPTRQAWFLHRADGELMAFAGIWAVWDTPAGAVLLTCSIVTTHANDGVAPVHDRMPVILERDAWDVWLDRGVDAPEAVSGLLQPAAEGVVVRYPVGPAVGNVRNNAPDLLDPVPGGDPPPVPLRLL